MQYEKKYIFKSYIIEFENNIFVGRVSGYFLIIWVHGSYN